MKSPIVPSGSRSRFMWLPKRLNFTANVKSRGTCFAHAAKDSRCGNR